MDPSANETAQGADDAKGQGSANAGNIAEKPRQSTLFDLPGIAAPVVDAVPVPDDAEHLEIAERADALRRYLLANPSGGTLETALAWAGIPVVPRGRPWVVNAEAPRAAMRAGWAVRSGGICRAVTSRAAHHGLVRHYLPAEVKP
jgi:hypothetical protein